MSGMLKPTKLHHFLLAGGAILGLLGVQAAVSLWAGGWTEGWTLFWCVCILPGLLAGVCAAFAVKDIDPDWPTVLAVLMLVGIGTLMALRLAPNAGACWKLLATRAAGCAVFVGVVLGFRRKERLLGLLRRYYLIAALTMAAGLLLSLFVKVTSDGVFFFRMVPWDFFKVLLVIAFAGYLSDHAEELAETRNGLPRLKPYIWGPLIVMWCVPIAGMLLLHDFGQVLIYGILLVVLLYLATGKAVYPASVAVVAVAGTAAILAKAPFIPERIIYRFDICFNLWRETVCDAWWERAHQTVSALLAVDNGGVLGGGLGSGFPTLVPVVRNDFIYVALVEEGGALLAAAVLWLYLIILLRGLALASSCGNRFLRMLAAGFSVLIGIQALVNLAGVLNLIPMTGISLPFVSASGASLVTNMAMAGFLVAIGHCARQEAACAQEAPQ